jgi:hypothetical protein
MENPRKGVGIGNPDFVFTDIKVGKVSLHFLLPSSGLNPFS